MIFETLERQSIVDWYPILGWDKLPNFGSCHTSDCIEKFVKSYYQSKDIAAIYTNICETLKNDANSHNVRLAGDPGAGKTSFLYAIKKMSEHDKNENILSSFFFYIFHINKADGDSSDYKLEVLYHIKRAWKQFYINAGPKDVYTRFRSQEISTKDLINKLSDYYKNHKKLFTKTMVFIVDDVDLLPGEHVGVVVENVIKNIEINSVKKWLVIRKVTFDNYSAATKQKIEQFFPDPYTFPTISLNELVDFRIENTSGSESPKLPFSKSLCDETILPICEGSLREGLALLKSILEENLPGKFKDTTDQSVISNYIENCAIRTLLSSQKLIDLHSRLFRVSSFPIAIDILACARFHSSVEIIYGSVSDCLVERNRKAKNIIGGDESIFKLRQADYNNIMNKLVDHGLVRKEGKDRILISDKGQITSSFSVRDFYFEHSKLKSKLAIDDEIYWQLSEKNINHKEIVDTYLTWKKNN
ncbi:hypothetical protein AB6C82_05185 [Vibrio splendidus]